MPRKVRAVVAPESREGPIQVEVTLPVRQRRGEGGRPPNNQPCGSADRFRIPRITRLMALAIKFQGMVDQREVRDYADLARLGYVTRARLTQIMNLLLLAPDIQEAILDNSNACRTTATITERDLRSVSRIIDWAAQRRRLDGIARSLSSTGVEGTSTLVENRGSSYRRQ